MKKSHIFFLVVIAIAISILISTAGDTSSYIDFETAKTYQEQGNNNDYHIVGELKKDASGKVLGIETSEDKLSFSFVMVDENQREQKVYYKEPMPTDFMKSEKVVVEGSYHNEVFIAEKILLKCPSKYEETSIKAGS